MSVGIGILAAVITCVAMEPYSALVHRFAWHGPLWLFHKHHHRHGGKGGINPNDGLSASHAPISIALLVLGLVLGGAGGSVLVGVGLGMTVYGGLYFVFHDGVVHGRLPVAFLLRWSVCRAWKDAHELHHRSGHRGPWGFFTSPLGVGAELNRRRARTS